MFREIEIAEIAGIVFREIGMLTARGVQVTVTATDIWVQVALRGYSEKDEQSSVFEIDFFPGDNQKKMEFLEKTVRDLNDFNPYEYIVWARDRYKLIF